MPRPCVTVPKDRGLGPVFFPSVVLRHGRLSRKVREPGCDPIDANRSAHCFLAELCSPHGHFKVTQANSGQDVPLPTWRVLWCTLLKKNCRDFGDQTTLFFHSRKYPNSLFILDPSLVHPAPCNPHEARSPRLPAAIGSEPSPGEAEAIN